MKLIKQRAKRVIFDVGRLYVKLKDHQNSQHNTLPNYVFLSYFLLHSILTFNK